MPELRWPYGYLYAVAVMLLVAGGMLWYFWRKGWLTEGRELGNEARAKDDGGTGSG